MFEWYDDPWSWALLTRKTGFSATYAIVMYFAFVAYLEHAVVEKAYKRVRAYRGRHAIETIQTVEVTTYPLVSGIRGVRGRWDAARIVAVLLTAFACVLGSGATDGPGQHRGVSHRSLPPATSREEKQRIQRRWRLVIPPDKLIFDEGDVANMYGNFPVGNANARYKVETIKQIIDGKVRIASWNTDVEDITTDLFYDDNGQGVGNVTSVNCFSNETIVNFYVEGESEPWGIAIDCKNGPQRVNGTGNSCRNVVKFTSRARDVHFIVEESITYPSFLYSVWKAQNHAVQICF